MIPWEYSLCRIADVATGKCELYRLLMFSKGAWKPSDVYSTFSVSGSTFNLL